jgi:hypothetical protein
MVAHPVVCNDNTKHKGAITMQKRSLKRAIIKPVTALRHTDALVRALVPAQVL